MKRSLAPAVALALSAFAIADAASPAGSRRKGPPERLADTGLYADASTREIAAGVLPFSPQYALWSDGAEKRRWIRLPPGAAIDARDPRDWRFPVGTRIWKEFSFGRPIETRYMERTRAGWIFATYAWSEDGKDARLAPERGVRAAYVSGPVRHDLPGVQDCKACHDGRKGGVLGFELLQLSPDRDPGAPNARAPEPGSLDLPALVRRGLVRGLPREVVDAPPRVAARTPVERAALGYLHANCSNCHNATGPLASLGLSLTAPLAGTADAVRTGAGVESRWRPAGADRALRIAPGDPAASTLVQRMASRHAAAQMPPLGTSVPDAEALRAVEAWVIELR